MVDSSPKKFRNLLLGCPCIICRAHQALKSAFGKIDVHGRLARWLKLMAEIEFEIRHLPGNENVTTDYLSRSAGFLIEECNQNNLKLAAFLDKYECWKPCEGVNVMDEGHGARETGGVVVGQRSLEPQLQETREFLSIFDGKRVLVRARQRS